MIMTIVASVLMGLLLGSIAVLIIWVIEILNEREAPCNPKYKLGQQVREIRTGRIGHITKPCIDFERYVLEDRYVLQAAWFYHISIPGGMRGEFELTDFSHEKTDPPVIPEIILLNGVKL